MTEARRAANRRYYAKMKGDPGFRARLAEKAKRRYHDRYGDDPSAHTLERRARLYGISVAELQHLLKRGVCDICGTGEMGRLNIDHCHATGRVRGVLCTRCNTGLGYVEREGWLKKAQAYL